MAKNAEDRPSMVSRAANRSARLRKSEPWRWLAALLIGAGGLFVAPAATADGLAVIVSRDWTSAVSIDRRLLKRLYMGKIKSFAGAAARPVNQARDSAIRDEFNDKILRKSEAKLSEYWIAQALDGGSRPPIDVDSYEKVVSKVASDKGAIGYVDLSRLKADAPAGVKVIAEFH